MLTTRCRGAILAVVAAACVPAAALADDPAEGVPGGADIDTPVAPPLFEGEEDEAAEFEAVAPLADPLEPGNRVIFGFNQKVDDWLWSPITRVYQFVTPEPLRRGVRRALRNLNAPIFFANNLLQLRVRDAGETLGAFALNSTLGILGFLEPSKEAGWEAHPADFGQTLDLVGVASGPYVVVPLLGPTTVRDGFGSAVDHFLQPLNWVIGVPTQLFWGGGAGLSLREEVDAKVDALEKSSIDFYSVMRSAYAQNRDQEIAEARSRRHADLALVVPASWLCDHGAGAAQD